MDFIQEESHNKFFCIQGVVRCYALFRFHRYVPPPVYPAAYAFEFQSCDLTPQAKCCRIWLKLKLFRV